MFNLNYTISVIELFYSLNSMRVIWIVNEIIEIMMLLVTNIGPGVIITASSSQNQLKRFDSNNPRAKFGAQLISGLKER